MNNILIGAAVLGGGYLGFWNWKRKCEHKKQILSSFVTLLSDDDLQVPATAKVPIQQTAANLVDMYFRKNKAELTSTANMLTARGYAKTATSLVAYANTLK